jgi:hypothetical protein
MSAQQLPDGVVLGSAFDIRTIGPSLSFFFDDQPDHVYDVQRLAIENGLNLMSVLCLPTQMTLYGVDGKMTEFDCRTGKIPYVKHKHDDIFVEAVKTFIPEGGRSYDIGPGITTAIIGQIIAKEREHNRIGLYFFDFDMLLSQFGGLNFTENPEKFPDELLEQYAKYLFSDYVGLEPETGRLNLLKSMFEAIGPERIYIITANPCADTQNPLRIKFVKLIQVLLRSFDPTHLIYASAVKTKQGVIIPILYDFADRHRGGARSKARRTRSKARKTKRTKSKARKTRTRTRSKARTSRRSRCSRRLS